MKLAIAVICVFVSLVLTGCKQSKLADTTADSVDVIVEDDGQFPKSLAGRWKAEGDSGWEFVFNPDGTISSCVTFIGRTRLVPGEVTKVSTKRGGKGESTPGEWTVEYDPKVRELEVVITLEHFYQEMGDNSVEGSSTDMFIGKISQNEEEWIATWYSFPIFTAYTDQRYDLPVDPNNNPKDILTFKKIASKED